MKLRIVLVDDHTVLREGLRALLGEEPDMEVVGGASTGREAVELCEELTPDVVVMDVGMPDMNGIEATRRINRASPGTRVLALSTYKDARYAAGMIQAGASGYVVKSGAYEELAGAIRHLARGHGYLSPEVTSGVIQRYAEHLRNHEPSALSLLTEREREVLQLVAEGKSTREIAQSLHVSTKTVDTHRQSVMDKLGLHSVAELTRYAIREGVTPP